MQKVKRTNLNSYPTSLSNSKILSPPLLKADTGASATFIKPTHANYLQDLSTTVNGPRVHLPNNTVLRPSHSGILSLNDSPRIHTYVLPEMTNESLLSVGQLCDQGCQAVFTKNNLYVLHNNKLVIKGTRNTKDGLWDVPFNQSENYSLNFIIKRNQPKYELAQFLHACAFSPALDTFQKAINNGNFISWPGIREINFKKILGNTPAIAKGHLDQERQGLQSTKQIEDDYFPPQEPIKTYHIAAKIECYQAKQMAYSDLTGKFPHVSSRGNQYVLVLYDFDSNAILVAPLKSRQAHEITQKWKELHGKLTKHGHVTKNYIMDNECSADLKAALTKAKLDYELAPPHMPRNALFERLKITSSRD